MEKKYNVLKDITLYSLIKDGACSDGINMFEDLFKPSSVHTIVSSQTFNALIDKVAKIPDCINFLTNKRYIEEKKQEEFFKIGTVVRFFSKSTKYCYADFLLSKVWAGLDGASGTDKNTNRIVYHAVCLFSKGINATVGSTYSESTVINGNKEHLKNHYQKNVVTREELEKMVAGYTFSKDFEVLGKISEFYDEAHRKFS